MENIYRYLFVLFIVLGVMGCGKSSEQEEPMSLDEPQTSIEVEDVNYSLSYVERLYQTRTLPSQFNIGNSQWPMVNKEALVPSMCYTKHDEQYNPCYICHQDKSEDSEKANQMNDGFLQNKYIFSEYATTNHWDNLFIDRSDKIAQISDQEIEDYVNSDNYTPLTQMLMEKGFVGYVPDLTNLQLGAAAFDEDGFAKDGSHWVAFNYKPLPSTFWPVNGSTDDVMIRLAKPFRSDMSGEYVKDIYQFNLAIAEAALKGLVEISVKHLDERIIGLDMNGDGEIGIVDSIRRPEYYVGAASYMPVETYLYPRYTEFLHSVRYIGSDAQGDIFNAKRMKELRYMVKVRSYVDENMPLTKAVLAGMYDDEWQEKWEGNNAPFFGSLEEKGIDNKMGWWLQGFIEDQDGALRPQSYEETFYCMGCHTNLGSTSDQVFSFVRKVDGAKGWGYIDLKDMKDTPNIGETEGEILQYLKRVGGGSEFRAANDIYNSFYDGNELNVTRVTSVSSIYELIIPSKASALEMNKAYKVIVDEQSFVYGREGNVKPIENVHQAIDVHTKVLPIEKKHAWDMRLDWREIR